MGNCAIFGFCLRRTRYYKMTNAEFLLSVLALLNFIKLGVFATVAQAAYHIGSWNNGLLSCRVVSKLGAIVILMSEFVIVSLTHICYKIIVSASIYIDISRKFICYTFAAVCIGSCAVLAIPGFYDWRITHLKLNTSSCLDGDNSPPCDIRICEIDFSLAHATYIMVAVLMGIFLPTFYLIVAVTRVQHKLKVSIEKIRSNISIMYYRQRVRENNRYLWILGITCFGFTASYIPVMLLHYVGYREEQLPPHERIEELYSWYTFLLFTLTSVDTWSTPIAYLTVHPSFRRMLYKILCSCCRTRILKRRKTVVLKRQPVFIVERSSSSILNRF